MPQGPESPKNASEKEKKLLQIRGDLQGLILREDWTAIDAMIRGVKYGDAELARELVEWKNKWQQPEQTLLHDILCMPQSDPPLHILKLLVDTAPRVLFTEDESGTLPVNTAVFYKNKQDSKTRSLEIIRFLIECDTKHKTLSPITFWQAIRRDDEEVIRYLLTFPECADALTIKVNGRVPLYYSVKGTLEKEGTITPLLKLMIESTCQQLKKTSCCLYRSIEIVAPALEESDLELLFELARQDKVYCTNHLIDVARRKDTLAAKSKEATTRRKDAKVSKENGQENKASGSNGVVESSQDENGAEETVKEEAKAAVDENGNVTESKGEANGVASTQGEDGVVWAESEENGDVPSEANACSSSDSK